MASTTPPSTPPPSTPPQQHWCYHCDKRVSVETLPNQPDLVCFDCKFGFVESLPLPSSSSSLSPPPSSSPDYLYNNHFDGPGVGLGGLGYGGIDETTLGYQFLHVLRLLSQVARDDHFPPPPPPPPHRAGSSSPSDENDFLRIEIDGWDHPNPHDNDNNNDNENDEEENDDDEEDVRIVEIEGEEGDSDDNDNDDDDDDDDDDVAEEREEERRRRRDILRLRLRDFATRARSGGRNRILDWAEILMGLEDNSIEFRFEMPEADSYVGNPGDYVDAAEYEALLQNLADAEGRRGAPPASKAAVDELKVVEIKDDTVNSEEEKYTCAICKDGVKVGDVVKEMPCGHGYHGDCIVPWLAARNSCPVCRFELPTDDPEYGEERERLGSEVGTTVERYEREDMCDGPANSSVGWRDPGFVFHGVMVNLKPATRYFYKVGSDSGGWSPTYSFVSRDEKSDETRAFLFGDMGTATPYKTFIRTQDESISTIKWILRDVEALGNKPAFISHIGDISYARGYAWIWDNFFNQIEPVASKVAYHVCIGNHEYDWPLQPWKPQWAAYGKDGGGECGVPYSLRFKMPGNSSLSTGSRAPATRNLYYSFSMGSVHFVYFSTETDFLQGSAQYNFLKHDLENVDRKKTPFVVVQGHRPMYTTSNEVRDAPIRERMLQHLEPLFVKNNVTLALWGHVHRYERFCPINNFTCGRMGLNGEKQGGYPVHAVIGMAGQDWQPIWEPRPDHPTVPVFPQPERSIYRGGEFGYTRLVATKEKLTLSYVGNHDGEVHDMVEILATGEALSGGDVGTSIDKAESTSKAEVKIETTSPYFSQLVKGASALLLGGFAGYVIGYVSRSKRDATAASGNKWLPVKTEDL